MTCSGRPLVVAAAATLLAATLGWWLAPAAVPTPGPTGFVPLLVTGCAVAGLAATAWLWLLTVLVVADVLRGRPGGRGVPAAVRRAVLAACGLTLVGAAAAPACADPGHRLPRSPAPAASALVGLPLPDRPSAAAALRAHRPRVGPEHPDRAVTVVAGDTLWDLARAELGPGATDADVTARWRATYAANRDVIGPEADLILPGQRLTLPDPPDPTRRSRP